MGRPPTIPLADEPERDSRGRSPHQAARLFDEWCAELEHSGAASSITTIRAYRTDLRRWVAVLTGAAPADAWDHFDLNLLTPHRVAAGRDQLADAGYSDGLVRRASSMLRGWTRWLHQNGHLDTASQLAEALPVRRPEHTPAKPRLDRDELARVLAAAGEPSDTHRRAAWPSRDRLICYLMGVCALTTSEICELRVRDIDHDTTRPVVRIIGRRARHREITIGDGAAQLWRDTLAQRSTRAGRPRSPIPGPHPDSPAIVRLTGQPATPSALAGWVRNWGADARVGPPSGLTPATLTNTAAALLLEAGHEPAEVAVYCGYSSWAPLEAYRPPHTQDLLLDVTVTPAASSM